MLPPFGEETVPLAPSFFAGFPGQIPVHHLLGLALLNPYGFKLPQREKKFKTLGKKGSGRDSFGTNNLNGNLGNPLGAGMMEGWNFGIMEKKQKSAGIRLIRVICFLFFFVLDFEL